MGNFLEEGMGCHNVTYRENVAKMAEPIELPFVTVHGWGGWPPVILY